MDLGTSQNVAGVVTQGRSQLAENQHVASYKVQSSTDGFSWGDVDSGNVFTANTAAPSTLPLSDNRTMWF